MRQLALGLMARPIQKLRPGGRFEIGRWKSRRMTKGRLIALSSSRDNDSPISAQSVLPVHVVGTGHRSNAVSRERFPERTAGGDGGRAMRRSELRSIADILNLAPHRAKRGGR